MSKTIEKILHSKSARNPAMIKKIMLKDAKAAQPWCC